jgi:hypothetical protein
MNVPGRRLGDPGADTLGGAGGEFCQYRGVLPDWQDSPVIEWRLAEEDPWHLPQDVPHRVIGDHDRIRIVTREVSAGAYPYQYGAPWIAVATLSCVSLTGSWGSWHRSATNCRSGRR